MCKKIFLILAFSGFFSTEVLSEENISFPNRYYRIPIWNLYFKPEFPISPLQKKSLLRMSLEQFGAKGDGLTDDTRAIIKAFNSSVLEIYSNKLKARYKISDRIIISKVKRKKLVLKDSKFLNSDISKATFIFQNCSNIEISGGEFGYVNMPVSNGDGSQHVFQFDGCQNVIMNKIHIINSPEMGVAITNCNNVIISNSLIEHTFRDGTYSHYSANVKYLNNIYKDIKDDAMSFHDYGISLQKKQLSIFGYSQASNFVAKGNTIINAYQGFGSIGAFNISIINNRFKNTVIAGISVFNAQDMYPGGTALVNKVRIENNLIQNSCTTLNINGLDLSNFGQASSGRAAICLLSLGAKNQLNQGETKHLSNVIVSGNTVNSSGANGFFANLVDNLRLTDNKFLNCSGSVPSQSLNGDVVEIWNCTGLWANFNSVIDSRPKTLHQHGYYFSNVSGQTGNWTVKGVIAEEKSLKMTTHLKDIPK